MLRETQHTVESLSNPIASSQVAQPDHHGVDMLLFSVRRPAASDSTKCVQSNDEISPILGFEKLLLVHAQTECLEPW